MSSQCFVVATTRQGEYCNGIKELGIKMPLCKSLVHEYLRHYTEFQTPELQRLYKCCSTLVCYYQFENSKISRLSFARKSPMVSMVCVAKCVCVYPTEAGMFLCPWDSWISSFQRGSCKQVGADWDQFFLLSSFFCGVCSCPDAMELLGLFLTALSSLINPSSLTIVRNFTYLPKTWLLPCHISNFHTLQHTKYSCFITLIDMGKHLPPNMSSPINEGILLGNFHN